MCAVLTASDIGVLCGVLVFESSTPYALFNAMNSQLWERTSAQLVKQRELLGTNYAGSVQGQAVMLKVRTNAPKEILRVELELALRLHRRSVPEEEYNDIGT